MNDMLYDVPEYCIANEGFSISNVKSKISNLIKIICDAIQRFGSWITSKFCKFFNIDMIIVNQDYYNEIMRTIDMVCNIDLPMISKVDAAINVLRNNSENVKEIYGDLQKKVDDIKLISENVEKIIPSDYGKTIQVSTSKLKHLKLTFSKMQSDANSQIYKLKSLKNNPDDIELLKYTQAQLTMIGHMATINCMKSSICMRLLDKLMENAIRNKETIRGRGNDNMNTTSLDSFISLCDSMSISNEGLNDYKKIYRDTKKDIAILDKEYKGMPENTTEEIDNKIEILKDILKQIQNAKTLMSKLTPNMFDKFINALAIVADATIVTTATLKLKNEVTKFSLGSPEIYHVLKNIAFLLSMTLSANIITQHGTFAGKKAGRKELYEKLSMAYNDYSDELYLLKQKKMKLSEK